MVDERRADDDTPDPKPEKGWERRLGKDRRKAERRSLDVPVDRDRRSGWDRRKGDRRES